MHLRRTQRVLADGRQKEWGDMRKLMAVVFANPETGRLQAEQKACGAQNAPHRHRRLRCARSGA